MFFNFIMIIPFGIYLRYYFRCGFRRTFLFSFLLSLFFELTQLTGLYFLYPRGYRLFDVDDLLNNTLGGIAGYLCAPGPSCGFCHPAKTWIKPAYAGEWRCPCPGAYWLFVSICSLSFWQMQRFGLPFPAAARCQAASGLFLPFYTTPLFPRLQAGAPQEMDPAHPHRRHSNRRQAPLVPVPAAVRQSAPLSLCTAPDLLPASASAGFSVLHSLVLLSCIHRDPLCPAPGSVLRKAVRHKKYFPPWQTSPVTPGKRLLNSSFFKNICQNSGFRHFTIRSTTWTKVCVSTDILFKIGVIRPLDAVGKKNILFRIFLVLRVFPVDHLFKLPLHLHSQVVLLLSRKQHLDEGDIGQKGKAEGPREHIRIFRRVSLKIRDAVYNGEHRLLLQCLRERIDIAVVGRKMWTC